MLSSITAKRKEIEDLLNDVNNSELVRVELTEITNLFRSFVEAQNVHNQKLQDDAARTESNVFFSEIEATLNFFCDTVNDWLRVTEVKLQDMEITPVLMTALRRSSRWIIVNLKVLMVRFPVEHQERV